MQLSQNWAKICLRLSFFKDLGFQTDDMFPPSVQRTEAANKARRLIFMIKRSFQDLPKSTFIPLNGALVRPHLEFGMPACSPNLVADINHLERIQRLATRLVTAPRSTRPKRAPLQGNPRCKTVKGCEILE